MAVESEGGRWWRGVDEVGVVVGQRIRQREAGEGVGAKNPKPSRWGSISGTPFETVMASDGGRWWRGVYEAAMASGRLVRKMRGWRGFGPETPKRAAVARFGAGSGLQAEMGGGVGLQAPLPW